MTYWPYLGANHLDEGLCFLEFMSKLMPAFRDNAEKFYGTPGACVPGVMTLDGRQMGGGTLFGLNMLASSRGVDYLRQCADVRPGRIGMYGLSQGGLSALFPRARRVCPTTTNWRCSRVVADRRHFCECLGPGCGHARHPASES